MEKERQRIINEKREMEHQMLHGFGDEDEYREVNHRMDQLSTDN